MTNINQWTALKCAAVLALVFAVQQSARAQDDPTATTANTADAAVEPQALSGNVPRLIKLSGVVTNPDGKPAAGAVPMTFTLYKGAEDGAALWTETQTAQLDSQGHYTVLLGASSAAGLPLDVFTSGDPLWLGVQPELPGARELPRVLLVAVPYALKAADADTLGGKPASAYLLSSNPATSLAGSTANGNLAATARGPAGLNPGQKAESIKTNQDSPSSPVSGFGTLDFIPIWTGDRTLGNSILFQVMDKVGVGTLMPGARLDAVATTGIAVRGASTGANGTGVTGISNSTSGSGSGVYGQSSSVGGTGVVGVNNAATGYSNGVYGQSASTSGSGLSGNATAASGYTSGVYGQSVSTNGSGVYGSAPHGTGVGGMGATLGVWGDSATAGASGVAGYSDAVSGFGNGVYGQSASPNGTGVTGVNNSSAGGTGVNGVVNATSGSSTGVSGTIASTSGAGVTGNATAASGFTNGVYGQSSSNSGYGVNGNAIATSGYNVGVYGQTESNSGYGVYGLANSTDASGVGGIGVIGINLGSNGSAGSFGALSGQGLILQGWSSGFTQVFTVDASGNLDISGNLTVAGSKSARVKLEDGREVALYAVESPENWFEDFGTAQLRGGAAQVSLEPGFLQTVDTAADYHVFLTANGDCRGLYVANKTAAGFEVRELGGGSASISFDYRIVAHRRGFETVRLQDIHPPQGPKDMQTRLANMRPGQHGMASPPRVGIPALPRPPDQTH